MIHDSYLHDFVLADRQAKILINFILSMNIFNGNVLIGKQLNVVKTTGAPSERCLLNSLATCLSKPGPNLGKW